MSRLKLIVLGILSLTILSMPNKASAANNKKIVNKIISTAEIVGKTGDSKTITLKLQGTEDACCDQMQDIWDACDEKLLKGTEWTGSSYHHIMQDSNGVDWIYKMKGKTCIWKVRFYGKEFKRDWTEFCYWKKNIKQFKAGLSGLDDKEKVEYTVQFIADRCGKKQKYSNEQSLYKKCFVGDEEEVANKVTEYLYYAKVNDRFGVIQNRSYDHAKNWIILDGVEYWFTLTSGLEKVTDNSDIIKYNGSTYCGFDF